MASRQKYRSYTAKEKLEVLKYASELGYRAAGRKYDIPESNIRSWKRQKGLIEQMPKNISHISMF